MAKNILHHSKPSSLATKDKSLLIASSLAIFLFCTLWYLSDSTFSTLLSKHPTTINNNQTLTTHCNNNQGVNRSHDPQQPTFYDDQEVTYTIDKPMKKWDEKRREWLKLHPSFAGAGADKRVLLLSGSQSSPCKNPFGDHLLLRGFKNKVDYCRIHGYDIFYNTAFLNPKMTSYWAKIPLVRAAMVAHPEVEWIMWMDSDAIFTDMEFKVPFDRYKNHNFVVHGWPNLVYEKKSWVAVNAGIFLIRNCQWSMDFLDAWALMGPKSPDYKTWGQTLKSTFKDKLFPESDDQSALIYLILKHKKQWGDMIYIENEYSLHGYWVGIVGKLDDISGKYIDIEKRDGRLRRRHGEAVSESYGVYREQYFENGDDGKDRLRRPFITHFTGCQPCSGNHNPDYIGDSCWVGMERALNFADNQVMRNFGFVHEDLKNSSIAPLPYDYPAEEFGEFV